MNTDTVAIDSSAEEIANEIIAEFSIMDNAQDILSEEENKLLQEVLSEVHKEIPTNSSSLLVDEATSRFSSAVWYNKIQEKTITLAGIGGIGSYVAFLLSRLKVAHMNLYDPDTVESVNMSGQLYSKFNVGHSKVDSIASMVGDYSNYYSIYSLQERFTEACTPTNIMICGFDNMNARKVFFNSWKSFVNSNDEESKSKCLFIDGRLAAEEFQVLCISGDDSYNIDRYEKEFLFSDAEADETICSYKQTTFMANMIASVMVNLFVNFVANQCEPLVPRDLPFYTSYSAETMYYKTEA